ncbi:MAG: hypothetical protein QM504_00645, partial [Pseudomonadota bacterium]
TEAPNLAKQWGGRKQMLLMEDLCLIEVVDADGKAVTDGSVGDHLYVTNFTNRGIPIIRYKIDDILCVDSEQSEDIPFRAVKQLYGRTPAAYVMYLPEERVIHIFALMGELWGYPQLARFQVYKAGPAALGFRLVPRAGVDHQVLLQFAKNVLQKSLKKHDLMAVQVHFELCEFIPENPDTGKVECILPDNSY